MAHCRLNYAQASLLITVADMSQDSGHDVTASARVHVTLALLQPNFHNEAVRQLTFTGNKVPIDICHQ
jgi:hypothetical protein